MSAFLKLARGPVMIWAALFALLFATLGYAYLPEVPLKAEIGLGLGLAKAGLIVSLFMELPKSSMLVRLAAGSGLVWLSMLFLFAGADYLTR